MFCTDPTLRERLAGAMHDDEAIAVAGISDHASALLEIVDRDRPDAVLVDAPSAEWLDDWRRRRQVRTTLIILLENAEGDMALDAFEAGAQAILLRSAAVAEIVTAIKAVAGGYAVLPRSLLALLPGGKLIGRSHDNHKTHPPQLTPRELEVLGALADGASNKAIARRLGISFHTVKFHVAAVLAKLDAESRTEAIAKAAQLGLVML
jgi:DNA-binding NarL/FixJ family response regulator